MPGASPTVLLGAHQKRVSVVDGTRRIISPEQTLANIEPLFHDAGITRVADVTGLDTVGIPVAIAVRPNARSLSVSQGKGLTLAAAKVSAAMEALELHHAEHIEHRPIIASVAELSRRGASLADPGALPRRAGSRYHRDLRIPWLTGTGARSGAERLVPMEMVDMDCVVPRPYTTGVFYGGSNGLASGNCIQEAMAHALCEVVERDAKALWWHRGRKHHDQTRIDPNTIDDPTCRRLLGRFDRADVDIALWDLTSDLGVPTIRCLTVDRTPFGGRRLMVNAGQGCHLDSTVALGRALTEAAQARLTAITGSRDDISRASIDEATDPRFQTTVRNGLFGDNAVKPRSFRDIASQWHPTLEQDIEAVLDRLATAHVDEPVMVDLTRPGTGIAVVKMVAAGLEANPAEAVLAGPRLGRVLDEAAP